MGTERALAVFSHFGGCLFDIIGSLKKQNALCHTTTEEEAEYVSAGKACQQALWMKQALIDYDVRLDDVPIMDGNKIRTRWGPDPQTRIDWGIPELTGDGDEDGESPNYETGDGVGTGITKIPDPCLIDINEQICPRFILEFYSQFLLSYNDDGEIIVEFMFQDQYYSFSLEEFAKILRVPCEGACVFTDKWALYELANGLPGDGLYQTFLPSLDDIITLVHVDREGPVTRIRHKKEIDVIEYQVLTHEIDPTFKDIETIL
ncbi:hypothetical protein Tco_0748825 [Tanacetum coccineum]|uniref:Uncharacterized protein n=1 Tax=Tanacetum coccineum TaxID=301880 RepID=A0ABQ4YWQ5_9ASTR